MTDVEFKYPENHVLAVVDSSPRLRTAVQALGASGFLDSEIKVACGNAAADALNASADFSGITGLVTRVAARLGMHTEETGLKNRYAKAMRAGKYVVAVAAPTASSAAQQTRQPAGADWPSYNGSLEGARYSSLTQITAANASNLNRVCTFDTGENMAMQSGPVVVNGVLYLTTDTTTYAIHAAICQEK